MTLILDPDDPAGWREAPSAPSATASSRLTDGLNPEQREAVEYRGQALLIVAGAGSGKTRVLTHRIASLIESREAWPSQILAITFTNKAAAEMRERVEALLGDSASGMWISTFHSACVRILRREAEAIGLTSTFTIYDSADQRTILKRIIKELDADTLGFTPASAQAKISKLKNELADVESYARNVNTSDPQEVMFLEIFRQYTRRLRDASALDFDDLIAETVYLFRAFPKVASLYQRRFRHILVDEYQDTNHAQYSLIRELTQAVPADRVVEMEQHGVNVAALTDASGGIPGASLTVVGDSDQSIYAFRGADIRNIVEFERDFPGAKVVLLEQNYRSTQNILSAANAVISNNFDRKEKKLWTADGDGDQITGYTGYTAHDEAQFVADEIEVLHRAGVAYRDIAVFYRTNAQTRALEEIFVRSALPYRVVGRHEVLRARRDQGRDGVPHRRREPPRRARAAPHPEHAEARHRPRHRDRARELRRAERAVVPAGDAVRRRPRPRAEGDGRDHEPRDRARRGRRDARAVGRGRRGGHQRGRLEGVRRARPSCSSAAGCIDALRNSRDPQDETRAENVEELVAQTRDFDRENPGATLVDFLTQVSLVAAADELDDASGTVSLMTLHTAKGLEYHAVFLTGLEEGLLPHQMSASEPGGPAEERRLFYVGITRARKRLYLSLAMSRAQFGEVAVAMPSRYLQEIPEGLIDWRQSPGMATSRGGTQPRALNARRGYGQGGGGAWGTRDRDLERFSVTKSAAPKAEWANRVTGTVRDNGDLTLAAGDRIRHVDFGEGRVTQVTGEGTKRIAHVAFDTAGQKKLLIKIAPIEKL